jgi:hypothetical protein
MKEYNKLVQEINKNPDYEFVKSGRKSTIKLRHKSGAIYSVHPGDNAVRPLKKWMEKLEENEKQ